MLHPVLIPKESNFMKLNDLKISTQLRLGLGAIFGLLLLLAIAAWVQTDMLWAQTKGLYEHPFTVRRALGKLEVITTDIPRHVRDLFLAKNEQETTTALQGIRLNMLDAERHFDVLYARYLGPREDITALHDEFVKWNVQRDETIALLRTGKTAEAEAQIRPGAALHKQVEVVSQRLRTIDDFAKNKGDEFYNTALAEKKTLNLQLASIAAAILALSLIIAWQLLSRIRAPLKELTSVAEKFRQGQLAARSRNTSANEFGALSAAFNDMAEAIQTQMQISENAAALADVMLREDEAQAFCHELLKSLLQHTGSQIGAVYFLNDTKTTYELFDAIGLGAGGRQAFSATEREGEFGAALASRTIQRITDIPTDTRFNFAAVSGEFSPREILTIPILSDHTVAAVISLASIHAYAPPSLRLINDIWSVLTARVNGVLAFRKLKDLAHRLEHQNRELDEQKRELSAQTGELTEQNTELEMQKRQLDEANRLKSAFLSNMSHELRTPLNSVIALSGVLSRRLASAIPAEEFAYLEIIERNGKNLLLLINDLLDLSRIEAGFEEISATHFAVREVVDEVVAMLEPLALEKQITLLSQFPDHLPALTSDPLKCRHILQNLVGNAVKFTEQGQVTITASTTEQEIQIVVADTGIGIAAEHLPYIFDEFRQADDSTSRKYGGTGLGLAIAKKYARMLGGGISVESALGKGSTFTLRLPLTLEPTNNAQAELKTPGAPVPSGQGQKILVVEDSEPAIIQLTDILSRQGYQALVARNGKEALEQIEHTLPDAMILDLMMPEVDGFQVLKATREVPRTARLPVLILTAKHVSKEELSFLKGNNVHQLIQKGDINKDGLLAAVARMVAPTQEKPAPQPSPRQRHARPDTPVILIVEDNPDSRRAACALLSDDYQIIEADNGQAGIAQARACHPDIILMDIAMPIMDGIQALQEIRRDETLRHIPVVAVTASAMRGDQETILAHGFDGYLSKPIDATLLKKILFEVLD